MKKRFAIIHPFFGIYNRGTETFFMEITNYLAQYYDITVYSIKSDPTIEEYIQIVDCKKGWLQKKYEQFYEKAAWLQRLLNRSRYLTVFQPIAFFYRKFARKVWREHLAHEKFNLLFPSMGAQGAQLAKKYRKKTGVPFVYKGGGGIGPGERKTLDTKPDMFISIATVQLEWAKKYSDKVCLIPNGTYTKRFKNQLNKEKYVINPGNKLVLSVGNLDMDFKRQHLVIEAVSKLENVDLLMLGKGKHEDKLRQLAEEKLPGRHKIMGVHYTETPYYYQSADVFTLASLYEPFGIVYIEAMASGLPVVTTEDEVRTEIVGDAGLVCDVTDTTVYANTLKKALSMDWGEKPQQKAAGYDYGVIGEQYHELFELLMVE